MTHPKLTQLRAELDALIANGIGPWCKKEITLLLDSLEEAMRALRRIGIDPCHCEGDIYSMAIHYEVIAQDAITKITAALEEK